MMTSINGSGGPLEYETSLGYMLRLSGPMIVSTVSFTLMQFIDRLMVSRLGTDALAAVLPAGFVAFLPGGFALGAVTSLNTFVSQSLGRDERTECSRYFWQMVYLGLAYFLAVIAVLWPLAPTVFRVMGQPEGVIAMEVIYFRILLIAHIPVIINWSGNQFFMGIHRPIVTMCTSLLGQVVNVLATYALIFGKFGLPAMGIAGAGWGTFIGIAVSALANILVFLSGPVHRTFRSRATLGLDVAKMRDLLRVGVAAGVGLVLNVAVWGVVLSALVGRFGEEALAATSAVLAYTHLSAMPIVGVATALSAAVGKAIGGGRKELAIQQTRICMRMGLLYMGLTGTCFLLLREPLMRFWSQDPRVIQAGSQILICAALYQVFHAARIIYGGALRGAGDTVWQAAVSGVSAVLVLGVGGALTVRLLPSSGAIGPWMIATLSIVAIGLANRWRFLSGRWMAIDLFSRRTLPPPVALEPAGD
jgi:multidrug resistance protein, MATE family